MNIELRPTQPSLTEARSNQARRAGRGWLAVLAAVLLLAGGLLAPAAPAQAAGTITVNTTADEYGTGGGCSLREAVRTANVGANFGGCSLVGTSPFTINLPAGTYQLTIAGKNNDDNATGDLDILVSGTIIAGAGASSTTIQQTTDDRVIDFNPSVGPSFSGSISNLLITGGNVDSNYGGGGIIYGDTNGGGTLTLNGVTVDNNAATQGPGGGIASGACGNLTIVNSTISNNTASSTTAGTGGGVDYLSQCTGGQLNISNSTFSGNRSARSSGDAGGGLHISGTTATIQRTHFVNNRAANASLTATGLGGAIAHVSGTLNVSFSRFVGNVATNGSGIWQTFGGTTGADDNWARGRRAGWQRDADGRPLAATAPQRQPLGRGDQHVNHPDGRSVGTQHRRSSGPGQPVRPAPLPAAAGHYLQQSGAGHAVRRGDAVRQRPGDGHLHRRRDRWRRQRRCHG